MLRATIRSKYTGRSFSKFVPKSPLVFDASKQITVYTFEDDGVRSRQNIKTGIITSAVVGSLALSFEYFGERYVVQKSITAKILGVLSTMFFMGMPMVARSMATAIYLQSDGSTIHLHTATLSGVIPPQQQSPKPIVMKIEDIRSEKLNDGYSLLWRRRRFTLDGNGHILRPDLLFIILRGLPIEVAQGGRKK